MQEEGKISNEELLGPPRLDLLTIGLNAVWAIINGFIGWIIILAWIYFFLWKAQGFSGIYPYIFSMTWFFATLFTSSLNVLSNRLISPEKYKRWSITFVQVFLYSIFLYIFIVPIYVYSAWLDSDLIIYVFTIHVILSIFWTSIFSEILSNYRYILLGLYGSFIGLFVSVLISFLVFVSFSKWNQSLYILVWLIIIINLFVNISRSLFEYWYYMLFKHTGFDQLGDIFSKIEEEEQEVIKKAQEELEKFI